MLARQQVFEVHPLERFAGLAVGPIERDLRQRRRRAARAEHTLDIVQLDLFLEAGEREVLHHALQLGEVAWPRMMAQRVEGCDREPPRRTDARLDDLREHERCEIRYILGKFAPAR